MRISDTSHGQWSEKICTNSSFWIQDGLDAEFHFSAKVPLSRKQASETEHRNTKPKNSTESIVRASLGSESNAVL